MYKEVFGAQVMQDEREWIKNAAESLSTRFDNRVFTNIGVQWGCTMHCMRAGDASADLFGIDIDYISYKVADPEVIAGTFITADSREYHKEWDRPIHFLIIDGDHHYDTVKADILGWTPHVVVGGIVCFHDYSPSELNLLQFPWLEGVKRAVDEWAGPRLQWEEIPAVRSLKAYRRLDR